MGKATVCFSFRAVPENIAQEILELDIHRWLKSLNLNAGNVRAIDSDDFRKLGIVRVTLASPIIADTMCEQWKEEDLKFNFNNERYPVTCDRVGKRPVVVTLRRVPGEATEQDIAAVLAGYGEVLNIRRKKYEGIGLIEVFTGRATALMNITKDIPPSIMWKNEKIFVRYETQPKLCFICHEASHEAEHCPKKRKTRTGSVVWNQENSRSLTDHPDFPPLPPNPTNHQKQQNLRGITPVVSKTPDFRTPEIQKLTPSQAVDMVLQAVGNLTNEQTTNQTEATPESTENRIAEPKGEVTKEKPKREIQRPIAKRKGTEKTECGASVLPAPEKKKETPKRQLSNSSLIEESERPEKKKGANIPTRK